MKKALRHLVYNQESAQKHAQALEKCTEVVNFTLATLHRDQFHKFVGNDKQIILQTLPATARELLHRIAR
jgi:hypothetical protein